MEDKGDKDEKNETRMREIEGANTGSICRVLLQNL